MRLNSLKLSLLTAIVTIIVLSGCDLPTYPLQTRYVGENTGCVWQSPGLCPPYVIYYNDTQRATLKLQVKDNKVYNSRGVLFDTSQADISHTGKAAIYVVDAQGELYASNAHKVYLFHHSTIFAGQPVAAAGEVVAKNGIISTISNCSGHYKPMDITAVQIQTILKNKGYTRPFTFRSCTPENLIIDLDYKEVQGQP